MAAISANLFAAAAPSPNRSLDFTTQANGSIQPAVASGFANFLTQATAEAATTEEEDTDPAAGAEVAAALAAIGLVPQQLPVQLPTDPTAVEGAVTPSQSLATSVPLSPAILVAEESTAAAAPSRSVELQLNTAPAVQNTPDTTPSTVATPAPTATPVEVNPAPQTIALPAPAAMFRTPVASTPGEVVVAATRPPAVAPQAAAVVEPSPIVPAEIGYSLVGPAVVAPPAVNPVSAVGGTPSQALVEHLAVDPSAVEPTPRPTQAITTQPGQPFDQVLAAETPPDTTAPVQQVVTAPVAGRPMSGPNFGTATVDPVDPTSYTPPAGETPPTAATVQPTPSVPESASQAAFFPTPAFPGVAPLGIESNEPAAVAVEPGQPQLAPLAANSPPAEPPSAGPRVAPNAPPVAAQVCEAYVTHARVVENGGIHEFQLRLDPPELGEVKVRVLAMGDRVEARLVVSDDAVKRLIESQLPELRQRLEAAGVSVPTFDVTTDGGGKRADTGGDGWDRSEPAFAPTPRPAGQPRAITPRPTRSGGMIDVTA